MARNILILGASYGSLLATKLLMAGHNVTLVCRKQTAELINRDGTEVRIKLMEDNNERLLAFCSITFDDMFVIRDLKIIEGGKGSFVAMPSRKLTDRWCGDANGMLANDAIRGQSDIISLEPAVRVREMARVAADHPELASALRQASTPNAVRVVRKYPDFSVLYDAYLSKFGDRCLEELKLESETLHEDPLVLLRSIGEVARAASISPAVLVWRALATVICLDFPVCFSVAVTCRMPSTSRLIRQSTSLGSSVGCRPSTRKSPTRMFFSASSSSP